MVVVSRNMLRFQGSLVCNRDRRVQAAYDRLRRSPQSPMAMEPQCQAYCAATIKERIIEQFEGRAEAYDADNTFHRSLVLKLLEVCPFQPGQHVLDLACGTGLFALSAAAAVAPQGRVIGIDISPSMLQRAQTKAAAADFSTATQFICGDIEQLQGSLPGDLMGTFDAAACSAAIPFLTQPRQTLEAWRHWLKPGGRLVFNAFVPPAMQGYETYLQMAQEQYGVTDEFDPSAALGSPELVTGALAAAGYTGIQVHQEVKQRLIPAASPDAYGERLWQIANTNNPFRWAELALDRPVSPGVALFLRSESYESITPRRAPDKLEVQLSTENLAAFKTEFVAAITHSLAGSGRYNAEGQMVLNTQTVLNVVAVA